MKILQFIDDFLQCKSKTILTLIIDGNVLRNELFTNSYQWFSNDLLEQLKNKTICKYALITVLSSKQVH